jgi:hypothetical protein
MRQYTVLFFDGFNAGATLPEAPSEKNTVSSIQAAGELFRRWMIDSGNDYQRADGYGAPSASVYPTADYDGIAYGDYPTAAFERGPRGGVARICL